MTFSLVPLFTLIQHLQNLSLCKVHLYVEVTVDLVYNLRCFRNLPGVSGFGGDIWHPDLLMGEEGGKSHTPKQTPLCPEAKVGATEHVSGQESSLVSPSPLSLESHYSWKVGVVWKVKGESS